MRSKHFIGVVAYFMLLTIAGLIASGCGGGGGKSETVYPLSSQTRLLQPGDSWTYDDNQVVTIGTSTLNGQPSLTRISQLTTYGEAFGVSYTVDDFFQNAAREIIYTGQRGANFSGLLPGDPARQEQKLIAPQTILFGNWTQGQTVSFKLLYENAEPPLGEREGATLTIVGTETIKTRLGTFETWKVQSVLTYPGDSNASTTTLWYAPQIGAYVRAHVVLGGQNIHPEYDVTLTATTVPLSPPPLQNPAL